MVSNEALSSQLGRNTVFCQKNGLFRDSPRRVLTGRREGSQRLLAGAPALLHSGASPSGHLPPRGLREAITGVTSGRRFVLVFELRVRDSSGGGRPDRGTARRAVRLSAQQRDAPWADRRTAGRTRRAFNHPAPPSPGRTCAYNAPAERRRGPRGRFPRPLGRFPKGQPPLRGFPRRARDPAVSRRKGR